METRRFAARKPDIMGDAAHAILTKPSRDFTGRFCIDENLLREEGMTDFSGYLVVPGAEPMLDIFLPADARMSPSPPFDGGEGRGEEARMR